MGCVRPSAHSTTLLVDHLMARRGLITHPLEESVQGLDHSQHSAMYSRGEVKPSLSTAVSCQEIDCVRPSAHSTTLLVDPLMARIGFNTHPFEDYVQGLEHSQLAAMYSRSEVKPSLSTAVSWQTECLRTRTVCISRSDAYVSHHA